jgi:exosome complex component CSL4
MLPSSTRYVSPSLFAMSAILLPGQPLPPQYNSTPLPLPGIGCYIRGGKLIASVVGVPVRDGQVRECRYSLTVLPHTDPTHRSTPTPQTISIHTHIPPSHPPTISSLVIGIISRLSPTQATLTLTLIDGHPTPSSQEDYQGVIRIADVRLTERDKIKMGDCFRLGDLVKARVVSGRTRYKSGRLGGFKI